MLQHIQKYCSPFRNSESEVKFVSKVLQGIELFSLLPGPLGLLRVSKVVRRTRSHHSVQLFQKLPVTSEHRLHVPLLFLSQGHRLLPQDHLVQILVCDLLPACIAVQVLDGCSWKCPDKPLCAVAVHLSDCIFLYLNLIYILSFLLARVYTFSQPMQSWCIPLFSGV